MEEVLLPCFFCGLSDDLECVCEHREWRVDCYNCGARGPYGGTKEDAIQEWNKKPRKNVDLNNADALSSIINERKRQDEKWGEQNHDPFTYLAILSEEVGELAQAAVDTRFGGKHGGLDNVRKEAVHTAAVALAIVECLDRGKWKWPEVREDKGEDNHANNR